MSRRSTTLLVLASLLASALLPFSAFAAADLSSPSVGEFFDLPAWMPRTISADLQFGSASASNVTHRVDTNALANLYALFDSVCERTYHSLSLSINDWDVTEYGPTTSGHTFWMRRDPRFANYGCYEPFSNRVVTTRRLVEYQNFKSLLSAFEKNPEVFLYLIRPKWPGSSVVEWSSTAFDRIFDATMFPQFEWTNTPLSTLTSNQWANVMTGFSDLKSALNNLCPIPWGNTTYRYAKSAYMFGACNFGEPPFDADSQDDLQRILPFYSHSDPLPKTAEEVMREIYGADAPTAWLTNVTRRLVIDQFAAANQVMGALDRTIGGVTVPYSGVGVHHWVRGQREYAATTTVHVTSWSSDGSEGLTFNCALQNDVSVETYVPTAQDTNYDDDTETNGFHRVGVYVSPTSSSLRFDPSVSTNSIQLTLTEQDAKDWHVYYGADGLLLFYYVTISVDSGAFYYYNIWFNHSAAPQDVFLHTILGQLPSDITFSSRARYNRQYTYDETDGNGLASYSAFSPWPGRFFRVASATCNALLSAGCMVGVDDEPIYGSDPVYYDKNSDRTWKSYYRGARGSYRSGAQQWSVISTFANSVAEECRSLVRDNMCDYTSPSNTIPMVDADVHEDLENVVYKAGGRVTATFMPLVGENFLKSPETLTGLEYTDGVVTKFQITKLSGEVEMRDPYWPVTVGTVSFSISDPEFTGDHGEPDVTELYGASAEGRMSVYSQVDWSWNNLRRSDR